MRLTAVRIFVDDLAKAETQAWSGTMLFAQDPANNTVTFLQYPRQDAV